MPVGGKTAATIAPLDLYKFVQEFIRNQLPQLQRLAFRLEHPQVRFVGFRERQGSPVVSYQRMTFHLAKSRIPLANAGVVGRDQPTIFRRKYKLTDRPTVFFEVRRLLP